MQLLELLHNQFERSVSYTHKRRLNSLFDAVGTLLKSNELSLTALGRNIQSKAKPRSNIKKIDRLLGNTKLHDEIASFYQVMNNKLLSSNSNPWIHIDWSCICATTEMYVLRATLTMKSRSIVVYEQGYPKKQENNHATHKAFLDKLKKMLPEGMKPIIVTDAGYRTPWFSYIQELGWYFVGRLRSQIAIKFDDAEEWQLSQDLYEKATGKPTGLGVGLLTKKKQLPAELVLFKGKKKKRRYKSKASGKGPSKTRYKKANNEPLLLATNLGGANVALKAINVYRQRMRIEESFRDTKASAYGFGLGNSRTRCHKRMSVLLLIAAIATYACWVASICIETMNKVSDYQAQSSKNKGVLSPVFLGRIVLRKQLVITSALFECAQQVLNQINILAQSEEPEYEQI